MSDPTAQPPAAVTPSVPAVAAAPPPAVQPSLPLVSAPLVPAPVEPPKAAKAEAPKPVEDDPQVRELRAELHAMKVRDAVMKAAVEHRAIAPEDVLSLLGPQLEVVNGTVAVKGQPHKAVGELAREFFAARPYLVAPSVPAGGSGAPAVVQPPQAAAPLDLRTAEGATTFVRQFSHSLFGAPVAPKA